MKATYDAVPASVRAAREEVASFASRNGAGARSGDIALAVSEAATNVVLHAYRRERRAGRFEIGAEASPAAMVVVVEDCGAGPHPRSDSPGAGFGLHLITNLADNVVIEDRSPGTRLRMMFGMG